MLRKKRKPLVLDGWIFVVDACESAQRFECARAQLGLFLGTEVLQGKPLLVFANKQDAKGVGDFIRRCMHVENNAKYNDHALRWCITIRARSTEELTQ